MDIPTPLEQLLRESAITRSLTVGLPGSVSEEQRRFPLTPEGAAQLVERGFRVLMERGAASHIHYTDEAYSRCGVEIVSREQAFATDIVIYLGHIQEREARLVRRGALLLGFFSFEKEICSALEVLLNRNVITIALDLVSSASGERPFADIIHEIDGRAAIAIASSLLADSKNGKGILLGGVAGIVPCEVMIVGSDMAAIAAGASAIGLGATVRIFDNDTYRLRSALQILGPGAIGSSIHPRVFESALSSADIVVATNAVPAGGVADVSMMQQMKKGVLCFDLTDKPGSAFPAMPVIDLDMASPADARPDSGIRVAYVNAGSAVPRTVAMALSNTLVNMLDRVLVVEGVANALKLDAGLRRGAITFLGKCVNERAAHLLGMRSVDISLFLHFL